VEIHAGAALLMGPSTPRSVGSGGRLRVVGEVDSRAVVLDVFTLTPRWSNLASFLGNS
jgi:hypothetical protein